MKSFTGLMAVICFACMSTAQAAKQYTPNEGGATFRESKGQHYRILNKASYLVLDTSAFYLYRHNKLVQGEKIARPTDVYYFSVGAGGTVLELTIANLEKTFAANRAFVYRLHTDFSSDKDLTTFIPSLKTYKIKYAYAQSLK